MKCKPALLCLGFISITVSAGEGPAQEQIQWLSWPVTGSPFNVPGGAALIPPPEERFLTEVRRDVIIGLRADGTVVWKYVPHSPPPSTPHSTTTPWQRTFPELQNAPSKHQP